MKIYLRSPLALLAASVVFLVESCGESWGGASPEVELSVSPCGAQLEPRSRKRAEIRAIKVWLRFSLSLLAGMHGTMP